MDFLRSNNYVKKFFDRVEFKTQSKNYVFAIVKWRQESTVKKPFYSFFSTRRYSQWGLYGCSTMLFVQFYSWYHLHMQELQWFFCFYFHLAVRIAKVLQMCEFVISSPIYTDMLICIYNKQSVCSALHKRWSFPLYISSVNVTKPARNCGFGDIYWRNP